MTSAADTPPDGPIRRARVIVELTASTTLHEGAFPAGSGYIRVGDRDAYLDLICDDLDAARRLLAAATGMVQRLSGQVPPVRPVSLREAEQQDARRLRAVTE